MMLLLLVIPVWALVLLGVAALCAGARLGDSGADAAEAEHGRAVAEIEARRARRPGAAVTGSYGARSATASPLSPRRVTPGRPGAVASGSHGARERAGIAA